MPELPEVETTRRGIAPLIEGQRIDKVIVRNARLRWPIEKTLAREVAGQRIAAVERRAKYLLLRLERGTLILHLGMSGSLRVLPGSTPAEKHDHVDWVLDRQRLRLRDPRRFGAVIYTEHDPHAHKLIAHLGPEPLSGQFSGDWLYQLSRGRSAAVKTFLMDGRIVVGVGNIYANESLFQAGIHPMRPAGRVSRARYQRLADAAKRVLAAAIEAGGTTLRDFTRADGKPGYFRHELQVYGRDGQPCPGCGATLKLAQIGQRASVFCGRCQR